MVADFVWRSLLFQACWRNNKDSWSAFTDTIVKTFQQSGRNVPGDSPWRIHLPLQPVVLDTEFQNLATAASGHEYLLDQERRDINAQRRAALPSVPGETALEKARRQLGPTKLIMDLKTARERHTMTNGITRMLQEHDPTEQLTEYNSDDDYDFGPPSTMRSERRAWLRAKKKREALSKTTQQKRQTLSKTPQQKRQTLSKTATTASKSAVTTTSIPAVTNAAVTTAPKTAVTNAAVTTASKSAVTNAAVTTAPKTAVTKVAVAPKAALSQEVIQLQASKPTSALSMEYQMSLEEDLLSFEQHHSSFDFSIDDAPESGDSDKRVDDSDDEVMIMSVTQAMMEDANNFATVSTTGQSNQAGSTPVDSDDVSAPPALAKTTAKSVGPVAVSMEDTVGVDGALPYDDAPTDHHPIDDGSTDEHDVLIVDATVTAGGVALSIGDAPAADGAFTARDVFPAGHGAALRTGYLLTANTTSALGESNTGGGVRHAFAVQSAPAASALNVGVGATASQITASEHVRISLAPPQLRVDFDLHRIVAGAKFTSFEHLTHCMWTDAIREGFVPRCVNRSETAAEWGCPFSAIARQKADAVAKGRTMTGKPREVPSKKHPCCDCLFVVRCRKSRDGTWVLDEAGFHKEHNHAPPNIATLPNGTNTPVLHPNAWPATLGNEDIARKMQRLVKTQAWPGMFAAEAQQMPELQGLKHLSVDSKSVENLLARVKLGDRQRLAGGVSAAVTPLLAVKEVLEELQTADPGLLFAVRCHEQEMVDVAWAFSSQQKLAAECGDVLEIDATYCISDLRMPLVEFTCKTRDGVIASLGQVLIASESVASYTFALEFLRDTCRVMSPATILTDRRQELMTAIRTVYPRAHNQHCFFHIAKNIADAAWTSGVGWSRKLSRQFYFDFVDVSLWKSEAAVNKGMAALMTKYCVDKDGTPNTKMQQYLQQISDSCDAWAEYACLRQFNLGKRTTNEVELTHAVVKMFVLRPASKALRNLTELLLDIRNFVYHKDSKLAQAQRDVGTGSTRERPLAENETRILRDIQEAARPVLSPYASGLMRSAFLASTTLCCRKDVTGQSLLALATDPKATTVVNALRLRSERNKQVPEATGQAASQARGQTVNTKDQAQVHKPHPQWNGSYVMPENLVSFLKMCMEKRPEDTLVFHFEEPSQPGVLHFLVYNTLLNDYRCTCMCKSSKGLTCEHFNKALVEDARVMFNLSFISRRWYRSEPPAELFLYSRCGYVRVMSEQEERYHRSRQPRAKAPAPSRVVVQPSQLPELVSLGERFNAIARSLNEPNFVTSSLTRQLDPALKSLEHSLKLRRLEIQGSVSVSVNAKNDAVVHVLTPEGAAALHGLTTKKSAPTKTTKHEKGFDVFARKSTHTKLLPKPTASVDGATTTTFKQRGDNATTTPSKLSNTPVCTPKSTRVNARTTPSKLTAVSADVNTEDEATQPATPSTVVDETAIRRQQRDVLGTEFVEQDDRLLTTPEARERAFMASPQPSAKRFKRSLFTSDDAASTTDSPVRYDGSMYSSTSVHRQARAEARQRAPQQNNEVENQEGNEVESLLDNDAESQEDNDAESQQTSQRRKTRIAQDRSVKGSFDELLEHLQRADEQFAANYPLVYDDDDDDDDLNAVSFSLEPEAKQP
jgi:hypothetical protein